MNTEYRRPLDEYEIDCIRSMFADGLSDAEIASNLKIRRTRVEKIRHSLRLMRAPAGKEKRVG